MKDIITRDHEIYIKIEKLKKYEYTNCIVHEMMERSIGTKPIDIYNEFNSNSIGYNHSNIDISNISLSSRITLRDYVFSIFPSLYNDLSDNIKKENKNELSNDKLKSKVLNRPISINFIIQKYLNKDKIPFNEIYYLSDEGQMETLTKSKLKEIIKKVNFSHAITPSFSYEQIIPEDYKFVVLYDINLALPIEELTSYIKKIKDDFDTKKLILDTPSEMLDQDYTNQNTSKRYEKIELLKKNGEKKVEINTQNIITSNKNIADMFYIYDQECNGFSKKEILNELIDYHITFDSDRYDQYLKTAEKYIDDDHYKTLVK